MGGFTAIAFAKDAFDGLCLLGIDGLLLAVTAMFIKGILPTLLNCMEATNDTTR